MIPEHVAAYALGLWHSTGGDLTWVQVARVLDACGLGWHDAAELEVAAVRWGRDHLAPDVPALLGLAKKGTPRNAPPKQEDHRRRRRRQ